MHTNPLTTQDRLSKLDPVFKDTLPSSLRLSMAIVLSQVGVQMWEWSVGMLKVVVIPF